MQLDARVGGARAALPGPAVAAFARAQARVHQHAAEGDLVARRVAEHGGHVAVFVGDGPRRREDDAHAAAACTLAGAEHAIRRRQLAPAVLIVEVGGDDVEYGARDQRPGDFGLGRQRRTGDARRIELGDLLLNLFEARRGQDLRRRHEALRRLHVEADIDAALPALIFERHVVEVVARPPAAAGAFGDQLRSGIVDVGELQRVV